jgi:Flp pilus assembly protein TadG
MVEPSKMSKFAKAVRRFVKDKRGSVSLMAGLSAIPLIVAGGAAIDYDRAINAKTALILSLDTAVLYAATQNSNDMAVLTNVSQPYLNANYHNGGDATVQSYAISAGSAPNSLKATGTVQLTTYFMAVVGITSMTVTASSEALHTGTGRSLNLEVSLVLDNTNSMNTKDGSSPNTPIVDLKAAAKNFVTTVMGTSQAPYTTKIAVVPYNNGVNMGDAATAAAARGGYITTPTNVSATPGYQKLLFNNAAGGSSTFTISNCVTERTGTNAYTDAPVSVYPVGRQYIGASNICGVTPMLPLNTNAATINATIDAMSANYSTAGQVGIAWGWYTLSPNFGLFTGTSIPASYSKLTATDATRVKKIMILMTDGEYNSVYSNGVISGNPVVSGSYYTTSDLINRAPDNGDTYTQSNAMCTAIKASGVEVYTIAFQLDTTKPQRVALLNNCATDSAHALTASNSAQLNNVFQALAQSLATLRLTN